MKCATHPDVETNLCCGKCGKPICPRCMVQTPVGARCRECARLYRLPTFRVSGTYYLRAGGAALGSAVVTGLIWGVLGGILHFFLLNLVLAAAVGYAVGEAVSFSANRKRGRWLAVGGGGGGGVSYVVSIFSFGGLPSGAFELIFDLVGIGIGIYVAVSRLR